MNKPAKPILDPLVDRLRTRAAIRRQIATRKSVQEGKPDRIADLLDEAADRIVLLEQRNWTTLESDEFYSQEYIDDPRN